MLEITIERKLLKSDLISDAPCCVTIFPQTDIAPKLLEILIARFVKAMPLALESKHSLLPHVTILTFKDPKEFLLNKPNLSKLLLDLLKEGRIKFDTYKKGNESITQISAQLECELIHSRKAHHNTQNR